MTSITGKLLGLLFTQITKPLVAVLSKSAKNNPEFRTTVVKIGRFPRNFKDALQRKIAISPKKMKPPSFITYEKPPTVDEAFDIGAQFLAEILVYLISAAFLIYEYRQHKVKDRMQNFKIDNIKKTLTTETDKVSSEIGNVKKTLTTKTDKVSSEIGKINKELKDNIKITTEHSNQLKQMSTDSGKSAVVDKTTTKMQQSGTQKSIDGSFQSTSSKEVMELIK